MKQVINRRGRIVVEESQAPPCGPGMVRISLRNSLISAGTELRSLDTASQNLASRAKDRPDLVRKVVDRARRQGIGQAYRAVREKLGEPKPLGYSAAGVVLEVGPGVTRFAPGDRAACGGAESAHAEIVAVPENLTAPIPEGVSFEHAAFATVGSIAMQGIRRARPEFGEVFVVLGLGLVGQLCVQFARAAGLRVIGFDLAPERAALARTLGAEEAYALGETGALDRVLDFTRGRGADGVVVAAATKSPEPINLATRLLRERGRISIVGFVGLDIAWGPFYAKELDIFMSRSYGPGRYDVAYEKRGMAYPFAHVRWTETENMAEVLRMLADGRINAAPLVSAVHPVDAAAEAYAALQREDARPLGVLLAYPGATPPPSPAPAARPANRAPRGETRVAVIGCGNFAKLERLPYLRRNAGWKIAMLVGHTGAKVRQLAGEYGGCRWSTDYKEAIADPDIDLLVVAAPHRLHGPIALAAAAAGKDLLVEKPMAVTPEELAEVHAAVGAAGIRYACGFNRRFAPASERLKALRAAERGPCTIVYRANVGMIPPDSWMHAPEEGGGRIVGEACHFFDYCTWLAGSLPVQVSAAAVSCDEQRFAAHDNLISTIKYADGSTASVIYSTMGNTGLAKERVEFFCGGKAAVIDDFERLEVHGARGGWRSRTTDKGHARLMEELLAACQSGGGFPAGLEESHASHALMFKAIEAARTGAAVPVFAP